MNSGLHVKAVYTCNSEPVYIHNVLCMHIRILPYLCVVCIGQVSSDHSGSKSPVREVHHLGLSKDRKSTKNVVARS